LHNLFKSHGIALILAIVFVIAAHFVLLAYGQYTYQRAEVTAMAARVQQLQRQKTELERKKRTLMAVNKFMAEVRSLGLAKEDWNLYSVNVQAPVTFHEAQQILGQTTHSAGYYFKPNRLNMRTTLATEDDATEAATAEAAPVAEGLERGDILLKLRGAFVARHN
jgi:hypothetical protein